MQLTPENVARFQRGQMEVQNQNEGYMYRGEVEAISVEANRLLVKFAWLAQLTQSKWVKADLSLDYAINLEICNVNDIGDSRICLMAPIVGEIIVLFPVNGSKLDPAKVHGLQA